MHRRTETRGRLLPLLAIAALALLAAVALAACGGSGSTTDNTENVHWAGIKAVPPKAAPPLQLRNYTGEQVNLRELRGKAVLVTFIYTHCPDTCPLIVSHMKTALALLGPKGRDVQMVAVSTDPRGDNPRTVTAFLKAHGMEGKMDYLIGSRPELEKVWKDWNIVAKPAKAGRDLVEHSALIYGIDGEGKIVTLYPANFRPQQLVHDVPLLAER